MGFFKRLVAFFTGEQPSQESDSSGVSGHGPFTLWTQADSIKVNLISQASQPKGGAVHHLDTGGFGQSQSHLSNVSDRYLNRRETGSAWMNVI